MNFFNIKSGLILIIVLLVSFSVDGQDGQLILNQDSKIETLMALKKEIDLTDNTAKHYKIQLVSGKLTTAENSKSKFYASGLPWSCSLVYEEPNYKVWVGNFRTRLEADRALVDVKKTFANAFIFKPKSNK